MRAFVVKKYDVTINTRSSMITYREVIPANKRHRTNAALLLAERLAGDHNAKWLLYRS